jgi:serine/threonine protein kinase, bacterial
MLLIRSRRALVAAVALAMVAGCSANSGSLAPQSGGQFAPGSVVEGKYFVPLVPHPWKLAHVWPARHHHRQQIMFVADPQNNQILMYNPKTPNPSPEGSITTGIDYPFGVAVDSSGTLYVANLLGGSPNIGSITVYPKGHTSPSLTITSGLDNPYGIGVDSHGTIFATNLSNDTLVGYKAGATTPFETINFSNLGQALGVGTDGLDNVWVASDTTNQVYEIPAGSSTPQNAGLSGLNGSINVAFGNSNEMYVSNFGGSNVTVYAYGTKSPSRTITTGIEHNGPTLNGLTASDYFFQSNQNDNVVGYLKGQSTPFSTITGIPDPRGIASIPLVAK